MFQNATTVHLKPGKVRQALHILRTCCVPVMKAQRGFINMALVPDVAHQQITVISLWQTSAHALVAEIVCDYMRGMEQLAPLLTTSNPQPSDGPQRFGPIMQPFAVN
jgi:hypothetical protein